MNNPREVPRVSVCVIAFNHERHIRTCLESILQQEVDFDFEVIVGDDNSTDGTRSVIEELATKYSNMIKCIFQTSNTGGQQNYLDVHSAARGAYVAHIDGDDVMLPGKLRIQAAFLDANPACSAVFHKMNTIRDGRMSVATPISRARQATFYSIEQLLLLSRPLYHSSKMYRAAAAQWKDAEALGYDFYMNTVNALNGQVAYLDNVLGLYRVADTSLSATRANFLARIALNNKALDLAQRAGVDHRTLARARCNMYFRNALGALRRGYSDFFQSFISESYRSSERSMSISVAYHLRRQEHFLVWLLLIVDRARRLLSPVSRMLKNSPNDACDAMS